jgi:MFS family permease
VKDRQPEAELAFSFSSLVLPFYLPSILSFLGIGMVLPLLALFARHVGASVATAGLIVGLFGLGSLLSNIPAGLLMTRYGERRVLIAATILEVLFAATLGFTRTPLFLGVLVFFLGATHSVYYVTRIAFFRTIVPGEFRGRALAFIGGSNRLGQFVGPIAGGFIAEVFGFRYLFWIFALLLAVSLVFLVRWVPRIGGVSSSGSLRGVATRESVGRDRTGRAGGEQDDTSADDRGVAIPVHWLKRTVTILRENRRVFSTAAVAIIILQVQRTARQVIIPLLGDAIGLSVSSIGLIFGLMFLLELLLFYPAGMMMDRVGRKATAVPCLLMFVLSFALLPFVTGFASMLVAALVAGVGNGMGSGINMTLSTDFAPSVQPGEFIGVWRFIVDAGTAGGPVLVGAVAGSLSLGAAAAVVAALGLAGAFVMATLVPEPLKRTRSIAGSSP